MKSLKVVLWIILGVSFVVDFIPESLWKLKCHTDYVVYMGRFDTIFWAVLMALAIMNYIDYKLKDKTLI